jgi:CBS domain-containing protein
MKVKNAMTGGKIYTLSPQDDFLTVVKFLLKHKLSGAPVTDKRGKVIGIVSEKDLFYKLFPTQKDFYKDPEYFMDFDHIEVFDTFNVKKFKAKDLMTKDIISVSSEDHILKACSIFVNNKIRRLPVIDDGKLVGVVTTNDIYKRFLTVFAKHKIKKTA